jgi:antibiotic biosynthesis monooxygenase (ABM) superfamily enzyme
MSDSQSAFDGPATLIFSRKVMPGREAEYKAWVAGFQDASRAVKGFLGASTMGRGAADHDFVSIVRFDSFENLRAWEDSELRHQWVAKLPLDAVKGEATTRRLEGVEFWFAAPAGPAPVAPSPHKMALVLSVVVFSLVSVLTPPLRSLLGDAPQLLRSAVMVLLQVGLMTYVIMPRVTKLLAGWLFRR